MKYARVEGAIALIELSRGQEAKIDVSDLDLVRCQSWSACPNGVGGFYARSSKGQYMHRLIACSEIDKEVDHLNHDTLDNRRLNLRVGSHKDNMANGKFALTTHCPRGHEYSESNTYKNAKGKRICRACNALRVASVYSSETPEQREARRQYAKMSYKRSRDNRLAKQRLYVLAHKDEKREYDRLRRERLKTSRHSSQAFVSSVGGECLG